MTAKEFTCSCQVCGTIYAPTRNKDGSVRATKYKVCSKECGNSAYGAAYYARKARPKLTYELQCSLCRKPFTGTQSTASYCCVECKSKARRSRRKESTVSVESRRARESKRRALKRRACAERIEPLRVFERDKWRCHLCGIKTLKHLRGTLSDRAPELEHIISLADGGTHTWGNVACACSKCNRRKGASSFGQLGLEFAA